MTALQDNIYGREIPTGIRKSQVVIGRGGSGNARKSVSSASTISATSTNSTTSSRFLGSFGSKGTARTRRWSSASDDFTSVINITHEVADSDRYDLYTISSHSTSTNESAALSDIPSFISEYTFKTSSNPSSKSRPSTMGSNPARLSGQSDWLARIPRDSSSESLPQTIHESVEDSMITPGPSHAPTIFRNPFASNSSRSLALYSSRRRSDIAPWDDSVSIRAESIRSIRQEQQQQQQQPQTPTSRSPRKFPLFRKSAPRIDTTGHPGSYPSTSRFGQSNETVNLRTGNSSVGGSPVSRRNSNSFVSGLLRAGSRGD